MRQAEHDGETATDAEGGGGTDADWHRTVEQLYVQHFDSLCRSAQRLLDTRQAAEDAVQGGFVKFADLRQRPAGGRELSYLRSIVINEARSVLRRRQMRHRHQHTLVPPATESDRTWSGALAQYETETAANWLSSLSRRQRDVVRLRHLVGLSERETATALRISPGSVKTHSSRGLSSIRKHLDGVA